MNKSKWSCILCYFRGGLYIYIEDYELNLSLYSNITSFKGSITSVFVLSVHRHLRTLKWFLQWYYVQWPCFLCQSVCLDYTLFIKGAALLKQWISISKLNLNGLGWDCNLESLYKVIYHWTIDNNFIWLSITCTVLIFYRFG